MSNKTNKNTNNDKKEETSTIKQPQNKKWMLYAGIGVIGICIGTIVAVVTTNNKQNVEPNPIDNQQNLAIEDNSEINSELYANIPNDIVVEIPTYKSSVNLTSIDDLSIEYTPLVFSEEEYEEYIEYVKNEIGDYELLTSGVVKNGDVVSISYKGWLKENTVSENEEQIYEENMTTDAPEDLKIGSGSYIAGFEDNLIGANVGDTVIFDITFPEDYVEELSNKVATFEVTIEGIKIYSEVPSDEKVISELAPMYFPEGTTPEFSTFEEYKTWLKTDMQTYYDTMNEFQIKDLALNNYYSSQNILYDDEEYAQQIELAKQEILAEAEYYNISIEEYASYYGYVDTDEILAIDAMAIDKAKATFDTEIILSTFCKQENITITKNDVIEYLHELEKTFQQPIDVIYSSYYSVAEDGTIIDNLQILYKETLYYKAMDYIVLNTKIVE